MAKSAIILSNVEAGLNPNSQELANVVINRLGLMPRKEGSTDKIWKILMELYERSKNSYRDKRPSDAVMTVEEMALYAGITRQTMYSYLKRWIDLSIIVKTSYINQNQKVIIGYKLNGATIEAAFEKAWQRVNNHMETTQKYVQELQRIVKNEKISESSRQNSTQQ